MSNNSNVETNPTVKRKRRCVVLEGSSSEDDSAVEIPNTSRRRLTFYISESESESESGSDSSVEICTKRTIGRLNSDSSSSSDSEVIRRVRKYPKIQSHNGNDTGEWESTDNEEPSNPKPSSSKTVKANDNGCSSDSSDGQCEKCPICLLTFTNQEVGSPEACDHSFCADCIQDWARRINTCPVDRKKFDLILVRSNYNGAYVRSLPVQEPTENIPEADIDFTSCEVCGLSNNEDRLLLCVECNLAYHLECLDPPLSVVPAGRWICPLCREEDYDLLDEEDEQD